jgi:acyl carrier protein
MDTVDNTSQDELEPIEPGSVTPRLKDIVTEIIGEDVIEFLDFTEKSTFIADLEMDSIQIIHLAERVNDLYGNRVDFVGWLSSKPVEEILALSVSDVARFVEENT